MRALPSASERAEAIRRVEAGEAMVDVVKSYKVNLIGRKGGLREGRLRHRHGVSARPLGPHQPSL